MFLSAGPPFNRVAIVENVGAGPDFGQAGDVVRVEGRGSTASADPGYRNPLFFEQLQLLPEFRIQLL